ncbi:ATP-dependent helicase [Spirulina sp. CS-785/01]|uniref:ATP-dependent helicase n=1 Tax=Spirulina sp. CS-785/01 TaxID=3021716 RepID=UPI002330634B|nr:ATP-dependent helicase [Spirulina sp. CS-785/01]MDB9315495.1 ATP-dependent helicase [Spirulina sp. CS-785/01]
MVQTPPTQSEQQQATLQTLYNSLRRGQKPLADWGGGELAVSAVPGAGKSHSMAVAAAITITRHHLHPRKQLVVVTFTRSAANSIKQKIRENLKQLQLPQGSFVVHTLHGLALHIASRHPEASGLDLETSTVVTPNQGHRVIKAAVEQWIGKNFHRYQRLLEGKQFDGEETERLRRQSVLRTEILPGLANTAIHEAKSSGFSPDDLWRVSQEANDYYDTLAIAAGIYEEYERIMRSRNFIDYDDMILAGLRVLDSPPIRDLWQKQVFAVFEDEAQDSSPLQTQLLAILANHNLIRVGDPNQAINSTFTPADPLYFNHFCDRCAQKNNLATMNQSGRSSKIILDAANFVLHWVNGTWEYREQGTENREQKENNITLPFRPQNIHPVSAKDPQPDANPQPTGQGLEIHTPEDIYQTVTQIKQRVIQLLTTNPHHNAAILVRENRQGHFIAEQLQDLKKEHDITPYEVGEVERHSQIPAEILKMLQFLDRPHSPDNLKGALEVLEKRQRIATQDLNALATNPEQFLYPSPLDPPQNKQVQEARRYCTSLLKARIELPSYQLISFLGMSLKYTGSELATVQKLAERVIKQILGSKSLKAMIEVLQEIVVSERFEAVQEESDDLYTRPNQLTIITMHKAKGLDWDYVFLPFLHRDVIPGEQWIPTASQFLGDFTLNEIARAQIRTAVHNQHLAALGDYDQMQPFPQPTDAWKQAGQLKQAEEYRLLYVAMTRAKRLLWMSAAEKGPFRWSVFSGQSANKLQYKRPCPVIPVLQQHFSQV